METDRQKFLAKVRLREYATWNERTRGCKCQGASMVSHALKRERDDKLRETAREHNNARELYKERVDESKRTSREQRNNARRE